MIFIYLHETYVVTAHKNRFAETVLVWGQSVYMFLQRSKKKLSQNYSTNPSFSGALDMVSLNMYHFPDLKL